MENHVKFQVKFLTIKLSLFDRTGAQEVENMTRKVQKHLQAKSVVFSWFYLWQLTWTVDRTTTVVSIHPNNFLHSLCENSFSQGTGMVPPRSSHTLCQDLCSLSVGGSYANHLNENEQKNSHFASVSLIFSIRSQSYSRVTLTSVWEKWKRMNVFVLFLIIYLVWYFYLKLILLSWSLGLHIYRLCDDLCIQSKKLFTIS